jgi:CopA family copper-resistance protein
MIESSQSLTSRRRFVEGLALLGGVASIGWPASKAFARTPDTLAGSNLDLTIGARTVNITGRQRIATLVNGSMPGPILRFREGDAVTINVTNRLDEPTSIHWHGIKLPNPMDGVPGLTYKGIMPGETFTYRFPIIQSGTYWYHSHSGMQEQTGLSGPLIFEPRAKAPYAYDREHVVMLTDWTDEDPMTVVANLKQNGDYYNYGQRTFGTLVKDVKQKGLDATLKDRLMWGQMRMTPTDIMDVSGATYTFLVNGQPPAANWTALFAKGERVRLRFINGSSMTTFDVRVPGLAMTVVQADGTDVEPVEIDEFRIGVAETYDVIVSPADAEAYTIFAQAEDRSGYARATLALREGLTAAIPPMDPRPMRSMTDMGMSGMSGMDNMSGMDARNMSASASPPAQPAMAGMDMGSGSMSGMPGMSTPPPKPTSGNMSGMKMDDNSAMPGMAMPMAANIPSSNADGVNPATLVGNPEVDNIAASTKNRLAEAGDGLDGNGRRVLTYANLSALKKSNDGPPTREIEFHLTGNMERWVWGFDGKKFSEADPILVKLGERVRFVLINDTMMEHPIHLHGYLFQVENGQEAMPYKHTINVKPGERMSFVFTADVPGRWAFHCHLLYHMEMGMFRTVLVA